MLKKVCSALLLTGLLLAAPAQAQVCGGGSHHGGGMNGGMSGPMPLGPRGDRDRPAVNEGAIERGSFTVVAVTPGSSLTAAEKKKLYKDLRDHLKGKNLPYKWLDDLEAEDDTDFDFDHPKKADSFATYTPWNNTVHLKTDMDVKNLTKEQTLTLIHELFHAWYDQVPSITELNLSTPAEEGVAHAFETLIESGMIGKAVGNAAGGAASTETFVGTWTGGTGDAKEGIEGLEQTDKVFIAHGYGSMFQNGYKDSMDTGKMNTLIKLTKSASAELSSLSDHIDQVTTPAIAPPSATPESGASIAPVTGSSKF